MSKAMDDSGDADVSSDEHSSPYTMTEDILRMRLKKEDRGRYITQLYAGIVASLSALSFGTVLGWSNAAITHLMDEQQSKVKSMVENVTEEMQSWIASMVPLGCAIGVIPFSYCNEHFGPKRTMLIQSPFYIFTWILLATITHTDVYLAGRFFCGFLSVSYVICGNTLLVDSVHKGYLKHLLIVQRSSIMFGVLIVYVMGFELKKGATTSVCAIIAAIQTFLLFFAPESPVFLYLANPSKAEEALAWYRGPLNAYAEMRRIRQDAELRTVDPAATSAMIYAEVVVKGILIVAGVVFFQIFSGYFVFMFYSTQLWHDRDEKFDAMQESVVYGIFMFLFNILGGLVHYKLHFGVRKPLILSSSFVTLQLTLTATYLYMKDVKTDLFSKLSWIPLANVILFILFYEFGLSLFPEVLLYDYLPYQVYRRAKYMISAFTWFLVFIVVKFFVSIKVATYDYVAFGILAGISLIGVLYMSLIVIESKNKSLVELQLQIGGNPIGNRGKYRQRIDF